MYERYCRRNRDTPSFESFNAKHFTCLPTNEKVYNDYNRALISARRASGLPITLRLPSLYKKLSPSSENLAQTIPSVQVQPQTNSFKSAITPMKSSMNMSIRAPSRVAPKEVVLKEEKKEWTLESYKNAISTNKSILLQEQNGHMVHLVPKYKGGESSESLACKLTKSVWEILRGKNNSPLKMRDGSSLDMSTISLDEGDLAEFVHNRKKKISGPHFIRFSRI